MKQIGDGLRLCLDGLLVERVVGFFAMGFDGASSSLGNVCCKQYIGKWRERCCRMR